MVALDVDGTILHFDGTVSPHVRRALDDVRDAGMSIVLATGRSLAALMPVAYDLGLTSGYAVCSNGAVTCELDPGISAEEAAASQEAARRVRSAHRGPCHGAPGSGPGAVRDIEPQPVAPRREGPRRDGPRRDGGWAGGGYRLLDVVTFDPGPAVRALAAELPEALIAVEDVGCGSRVSAPFPPDELAGEHVVVSLDELVARPATRVVVRDPGSTREEFHDVVQRVGLHEVSYAVGWSAWLDLTPAGVSKASALENVRQRLGVEPYATVAVGDGGNDIEMLRWAARGVAMGHAIAAVHDAADEVAATIDDDGLVPVLRSLL